MIVFLIISMAVAFFFYRKTLPDLSTKRRYILIALRGLFIFFLLMLLFNPILSFQRNVTERPVFLLLSDKSNSMSQLIDGRSKTEHLGSFERDMQRVAQRSNYSFERIELFRNNPRQSRLLDEIRDVLHSGKEIRGIAIASDGWFHDDPALFRELINIPIYTFRPEISEDNPEITINNIHYNRNARQNEIQPIRVNFTTSNYEGSVEVQLKRNDRVVQRRSVNITSANPTNQIEFEVLFNELGLQVYEIEVVGTNDITDRGFAAIQVLESKSEILIITDQFTWDVRLFNRFLNFNERFSADLVYAYRGDLQQRGERVNVNWQDYSGFIIINHGNLLLHSHDLTRLSNMVLNGTGLIYIGNTTPLFEAILPSRPTTIRIVSEAQTQLRPEALAYQIFRDIETYWGRFPPIQFHYLSAKEQAIVLAEALDQNRFPVIFLGHHGTGNVLQFAFHGLWRWQMNNETEVFDRFVNGLAQWIFSSQTDNFFAYTNKNIYYSGEQITVHLSAFDERLNPLQNLNARLDLVRSDGNTVFSDFLVRNEGLFSVTLPQLEAGTYRYRIFDDINNRETSGEFEVLEQDIESLNKGFNHRLLIEMSQASGGYNLTESDLNDFSLERVEAITRVRYHEVQLYRNVLFIITFLVTFCVELYFRKKWGLL